MNRTSIMRVAIALAAASIAGAIAVPASAAPAVATGNVNVRTGPGAGFASVGSLHYGETVDIRACDGGWCYVQRSGKDGWVSRKYLARGIHHHQQRSHLGLTIGQDGFHLGFGGTKRYHGKHHHGGHHGHGGKYNTHKSKTLQWQKR